MNHYLQQKMPHYQVPTFKGWTVSYHLFAIASSIEFAICIEAAGGLAEILCRLVRIQTKGSRGWQNCFYDASSVTTLLEC